MIKQVAKLQPGDWFNAKQVEDAVTNLNEAAGNLGYAFADINPAYNRDAEKRVMNLTIKVGDTPRVYVERIDITGNTTTRDKVIRREFRLNEGDAFNALKVEAQPGPHPEPRLSSRKSWRSSRPKARRRTASSSASNVEEKPTGQLSAVRRLFEPRDGSSSSSPFRQNNFMGKGQQVDASVNWSRYSKSVELGFVDPYFLDKPILFGAQHLPPAITTASITSATTATRPTRRSAPAAGSGMGFPITEYWSFGGRYTLSQDKITLDKRPSTRTPTARDRCLPICDPLKAGRYLVRRDRHAPDVADRLFDALRRYRRHSPDARAAADLLAGFRRPRRRRSKYLRSRVDATKYQGIGGGWILSLHGEGGYIKALQNSPSPGDDADPAHRPLLRTGPSRLRHPRHRPARSCASRTTPTERSIDTQAINNQIVDARRQGILHGPAGA